MAKRKKVKFDNPWPDWAKSEEGKRCLNWNTLRGLSDKDADKFLDNRLWTAFAAGYNWPQKAPKRVPNA